MAEERLVVEFAVTGAREASREIGQVADMLGGSGVGPRSGRARGGAQASMSDLTGNFVRLGTVVVAVAASMKGLVAAVKQGIEAMNEFARTQDLLGGTAGDTGALRLIGRVLGVGDVAGAAAGFHQATLSGMGAATAAAYGLPIRPLEIGGATDRAAMLIQALEKLREVYLRDPSQATADARNLGLEGFLGVGRLSEGTFRELMGATAERAAFFTPERQRQMAEFNAALELFQMRIEDLALAITVHVIPALTWALDTIRNIFAPVANGRFQRVGDELHFVESLDANTKATNANTRQLDRMLGPFGGGPRFQNALPRAFGPTNGFQLNEAFRQHAIRVGPYALGN